MITFDTFQNSKKFYALLDDSEAAPDIENSGYVYRGNFYIEILTDDTGNESFHVLIGNQSWTYCNLSDAEWRLWISIACEELNPVHFEHAGTTLDGDELALLIEAGAVNTSWSNDICGSFTIYSDPNEVDGLRVRIWIDYDEFEDRESESPFKFSAIIENECEQIGELLDTDDIANAIAAALAYLAIPYSESEWGSDRQIGHETTFFRHLQRVISKDEYQRLEDWCLKATTEEMLAQGLRTIDTMIPQLKSVLSSKVKSPSVTSPDVAHDQKVERLAETFAACLRNMLTADEIKEVDRLNKEHGNSEDVCFSHNYCDANEAMIDAFVHVMGRDSDAASFQDADLQNRAWQAAKERGFANKALYLCHWDGGNFAIVDRCEFTEDNGYHGDEFYENLDSLTEIGEGFGQENIYVRRLQ